MDTDWVITKNIGVLNYYLNHPDIMEGLDDANLAKEFVDWSDYCEPEQDFIIFHFPLKGCLLCIKENDNLWESDIYLLKGHRGKFAHDAAKKVIDFMFNQAGIGGLITRTPDYNKAARVISAKLGFKLIDSIPNAGTKQGNPYTLNIYELKNESFTR